MKKPPQPTQEELDKVAAWWQWVEIQACTHPDGITYDSADGEMHCSACGERMFMLSETQIEEMKRKQDECG